MEKIAGLTQPEEALLAQALWAARDTRTLVVEPGVRHDAARVFQAEFEGPAILVADARTYAAAGADVRESFQRAGIACKEPILLDADVWAEHGYVERLQAALGAVSGTPVAVGSGTINDLTKLAAHRLGRPYMVVATAASMDGYTAYGASITYRGSKQTFECPAPRAVVADLEVIAKAPPEMNAAGYGDLLAKGASGADWILADAMGEEPIEPKSWATVQTFLADWVAEPSGIPRAEPGRLRRLTVGLTMTGFAIQAARSSRPASGAEHQFSHLWDMQRQSHDASTPSHGFQVGIGTLASLGLYFLLLGTDAVDSVELDAAAAQWPSLEQTEARIRALFGPGELAEKALEETRAKHPPADAVRAQIERLREGWPAIRERLEQHLLPYRAAATMLQQAGCPTAPAKIGVSRERLRASYEQACYIRRRYTVLDFAMRLGVLDRALDEMFGPTGFWADTAAR